MPSSGPGGPLRVEPIKHFLHGKHESYLLGTLRIHVLQNIDVLAQLVHSGLTKVNCGKQSKTFEKYVCIKTRNNIAYFHPHLKHVHVTRTGIWPGLVLPVPRLTG